MRYRRVKNVAWRRIGPETMVVNLGRRRMMALNEAGGAVWEALAGDGSVVAGEAAPFLAELEAEGVVERLAEDEAGAAMALAGTPRVLWREELHRFGAGCAFVPDQSDICNQGPYTS